MARLRGQLGEQPQGAELSAFSSTRSKATSGPETRAGDVVVRTGRPGVFFLNPTHLQR